MSYRLIRALRQFYLRREVVTKTIDVQFHRPPCREHVTKKAQAENDMTKTLVVVVLMFMSCQLLNPVRRIIQAALSFTDLGCGSASFYFAYLVVPVLALDVSSHFFIYSVCNKRFGEKLSQKWRRLMSRSTVAPSVEQQAAGPAAVHVIPPSENVNYTDPI